MQLIERIGYQWQCEEDRALDQVEENARLAVKSSRIVTVSRLNIF